MLKHSGDILENRKEIENEISMICHKLLKYNLRHFRIFLVFHTLLGFKSIAYILINNSFLRRRIDKLFYMFLYPALWADKLHK